MATLTTSGADFEIFPIPPAADGPEDAYQIRICQYGDEVWNRQYNVTGWQAGHSEVYKIGKAFALSRRLIDATLTFSLWRDSTDPDDFSPLQIWLSVLWLEVSLAGYTLSSGDHLSATVYVWAGPDADYEPDAPPSQPLRSYQSCELLVGMEEAQRFGKALCAECRATQAARRALNLTHYDDHLDFG